LRSASPPSVTLSFPFTVADPVTVSFALSVALSVSFALAISVSLAVSVAPSGALFMRAALFSRSSKILTLLIPQLHSVLLGGKLLLIALFVVRLARRRGLRYLGGGAPPVQVNGS